MTKQWWQFSLKALLIAALLVAVYLTGRVHQLAADRQEMESAKEEAHRMTYEADIQKKRAEDDKAIAQEIAEIERIRASQAELKVEILQLELRRAGITPSASDD